MKNIFLIIFLVVVHSVLLAQVSFTPRFKKVSNVSVSTSDTLGYGFYQANNWGILQYNPAGYVYGNNIYNDKAKILVYNVSVPQQIFSVLVGFGLKRFNSSDSSSHVKLRLYYMDKNGFAVGGSDTCPGSFFYNKDIPVYSIDTNALMSFSVDSFAQSTGTFGVGIDFSGLHPKDTVVLNSTDKGIFISPQVSWETSAQNLNYTMLNSWGFDSTPAIFPETSPSTGLKNTIKAPLQVFSKSEVLYIIADRSGKCLVSDLSGKLILDIPFVKGENRFILNDTFKSKLLIVRLTDASGQIIGFKKLIFDEKE
jgi:hypothetical protein